MQDLGRRILVGVQGSTASLAALRWGAREAELRGARLDVVRAWENPARRVAPYASHSRAPDGQENETVALAILNEMIEAEFGPTTPGGLSIDVAEGLPARVLLDHAAGAELLVLGSASRSALDGPGPVARACLRHAPCPVVVVSTAVMDVPVPA
ncbi:MAG TPA: universal stress protein [Streptosporangiaceae bacterium]|jgi:nucleotide-binding universal stress UspA family protein|nr:universal stress protein [Streptosporangiaceae bacterium]